MIDIPLGLRNSIETHNCVLFVGAGVGCHFTAPDGTTAPTGLELCEMLCNKFAIPCQPNCRLSQIAELVELRKGRKELETFISSKLDGLSPDDTFKWITSVRWRAIYTTNYDNCIERAYQLSSKPRQNAVSFSITSDLHRYQPIIDVPIFHIHGHFFSGASSNIIITKSDYARFREKRKMLFESFKFEMATSSILYVGYANEDPNWETLLEETFEDFYPSKLPQSFRIDPYADDIDIEILQSKNIHTIKCSFQEFASTISASTVTSDTAVDVLSAFKKNVPPDFEAEFNSSPIPVIRLLSSWEYVNQAAFNQPPNFTNFIKGDAPNWSLIDKGQIFERDIEGDLYDGILDFATTTKKSPSVSIVLGAAGYGTSTLLKTIAVKTVKDKAGAVFVLRPGASILEGDIEYASSQFPNVFFVVDDAADHASELEKSIHMLRETKKAAFFLLGERLNEWHQRSNRPRGQEYQIEPLSDGEIDRLLDFLGKYNALNRLESLPKDLQHSIIKERHQKELLVVLREATENNNFDAIIESEYRGIGDDFSKLAYLYICSFYQHGALFRVSLLSEIFGISTVEFYEKTASTTEGVIVFECIDEQRGLYAARARHHNIAAVVWERCADSGQKEEIVQKTLRKLNLNSSTDAHAFELFTRSDRIVDCIRTLEGRISFFEQASKIDPASPYVRQHYARMLSRSGQHNLALTQIENAIKNDTAVRVLYHTKGKILSELAINSESVEIGRRFLIQAEACFNKGISLNTRDDYGYESLASLYFDWANKVFDKNPSEATDYISKSEEIISIGLRTVRNRESLWVLSSKIQYYLGNTPKSISSLETAVHERHGSIIARYLLARAYRRQKRPQDALTILQPVVKSAKEEFRALIEYAEALLENGEPYDKAIAILELGTLYGLSDPKFISIYGGLLFLNGDFTKSDDIFLKAMKRSLPANELYEIRFKPFDRVDNSKPFFLTGEVVTVQAGYSLLKPDGYPQIICHASKYKGMLMRKGLRVKFELAFCANRPVALYPTPVVS
jgi:tetratricopeptide (TPR) repeat protein